MKVILCDHNLGLIKAWEKAFEGLDIVTIKHCSIFDFESDAVVSPANSFGFMDGGIDAAYMGYFGDDIQMKVRRQIYDHHDGELLVGKADIVETGHPQIPFLIAAPTMRIPMKLRESVNAYLAARAIFLLVLQGVFTSGTFAGEKIADHVKTVAIPGLGTGVGAIGYDICARQMRTALNDTVLRGYKMPRSWSEASERHQLLYSDHPKNLQL